MAKAYIFDMDGTIADSMGYFDKALTRILDEEDIDYPEDILSIAAALGNDKVIELLSKLGVKGSCEEIGRKISDGMIKIYSECVKLKPFAYDYLKKLKNEGEHLYLLTASPHITADIFLKNNLVYDLFDKVWSADDFGGLSKDEDKIYNILCESIGLEAKDIEFYDDNIFALKAAKSAGFRTVGVYDSYNRTPEYEIRKICDKYITSFEEMMGK